MANIIAKYIVEIYDDGSTKSLRLDLDQEEENTELEDIILLNEIAGRTGQILLTIKYVVEAYQRHDLRDGEFMIKPVLREALNKTADVYHVTLQSVVDKATRQLEIKMEDFRIMLMEYLHTLNASRVYTREETDSIRLKNALINSLTRRTGKMDQVMIERFFANPNIEFSLP